MAEVLEKMPRLDIAFVRYGITDRKRDGISGCIDNLRTVCNRLKQRYRRVTIIIETGMWLDYPAHYMYDRNARLRPLYEDMKRFASAEGYPVVDVFRNMEIETAKGNRDLRVRGLPDPEHAILHESFDQFFGDTLPNVKG